MITLRPARYYKPYSVTLQKFTHARYAGTEIPKDFSSKVTLIDPERSVNRDVLIYMNHPLRYRGETFYQAGFQKDDSATILQVVHNPSFIAPYVACVIVAAGLLVQFGFHLVGFAKKTEGCAGMKRFRSLDCSVLWPRVGSRRIGCRSKPAKRRFRSCAVSESSSAGRRTR